MPTDAKGSASKAKSQRLVDVVGAQAAQRDPPTAAMHSCLQICSNLPCRDADTTVQQALTIAVRNGKLVRFTRDGQERLGRPTASVMRVALGNPDDETIRDAIEAEVGGECRKSYVGALNELLAERAERK